MVARALALVGLAALVGCETPPDEPTCGLGELWCPSQAEAPSRRVLVIGLDGVRGDVAELAATPAFDRLTAQGAFSYRASTQLDAATSSGPGWASILTGVDAAKHGVDSNDEVATNPDYPTFMARAHDDLGLSTAAAVHWIPVQAALMEDDVVDELSVGGDEHVTDSMADLLREGDHALHFVHLDDVDHAGHENGFDPSIAEYVAAVELVDGQVGRLIDAIEARATLADEDWLIALTSDHGGDLFGHGALSAEHRTIPLVFAGPLHPTAELVPESAFEPGDGFVSHMDVHATVMTHLGLPPDASWGLDGIAR